MVQREFIAVQNPKCANIDEAHSEQNKDVESEEDSSSSVYWQTLTRQEKVDICLKRRAATEAALDEENARLLAAAENRPREQQIAQLGASQQQLDRVGCQSGRVKFQSDRIGGAAAENMLADIVAADKVAGGAMGAREEKNKEVERGAAAGLVLDHGVGQLGRVERPAVLSHGVGQLGRVERPAVEFSHGVGQLGRVEHPAVTNEEFSHGVGQLGRVERPAVVFSGAAKEVPASVKEGPKASTPNVPKTISYKSALLNEEKEDPNTSKFKKNRNWNRGNKLDWVEEFSNKDEILIADREVDDVTKTWGFCLVGYVAGEDLGKGAIIACCNAWKVAYNATFDDSGWVVIKFDTAEARDRVLDNGPYVIFSRPFVLKPIPQLFDFSADQISKVPVWVKLPRLPLELWNDDILSKIGSMIGVPIRTDEMTASREGKAYARMFVEVDVSKDLKREVTLKFSKGKEIKQKVIYEYVPSYCNKCNAIGHENNMCNDRGFINRQKADYQRKGKAVVKEDLAKRFVDDRHRVGEGVPNPNTTNTTRAKVYGLGSTPRETNRGKGNQKLKYVEVNRKGVGEGVLDPGNVPSSSKQVAQPKGGVTTKQHVAGDHASKGSQNPREEVSRPEARGRFIREDEMQTMVMSYMHTFLTKQGQPKPIEINEGAICVVDNEGAIRVVEDTGDKDGVWISPKKKKHRRKKGGNSSNPQ